MSMICYDLQYLNYYKNLARNKGQHGEVIMDLPVDFGYGQVAEVALAAMLGRLQTSLKKKHIYFFVECSAQQDRNGIDFLINKEPISLVSQFSFNNHYENHSYEDCFVEYDRPGITNINNVLDYIGMEDFLESDSDVINDINNIWFKYMDYYILDACEIHMKLQ